MTLITGLDIGTTKVCCFTVRREADGSLQVVGYGVAPCRGLKQGQVVDMEQTVHAIQQAVHEAQTMGDVVITGAVVGVTGEHIESIPRRAEITITRPHREVTHEDLERLRFHLQQIHLPPDRELLHLLIRQYIIDGQSGILNPLGMSASHLQAEATLITGGVTFLQNLRRCVERAGLAVQAMALEPYASGLATLTPEEREIGVALIDIGGGTTDIAVFLEGSMAFSSAVPLGGNQVTRDVYIMFRLADPQEAERLKHEFGSALAERVPETERVSYREMGTHEERRVPRRLFSEVIEERMREILELACEKLERSGLYDRLAAGVVLTGGGSCLPCTAELGRQVFGSLPVRIGTPQLQGTTLPNALQHPSYATVVGLTLYGAHLFPDTTETFAPTHLWKQLVQTLKHWFRRNQ
ncbi:MAG: cell division protein FtsA [Armatimonadetes bacterium JP3_11]|nr:MAG: cell division protein FtsA [Armatimonadetes bacterium CP1_7O]OYT74952.1 MAG: cell division protein FtsA [Armatimonadetes bacterium JP3_11]RMH06883.1 MAG: cell division protein FtsA [Armatimonadota bacterium]